MYKAKQTFLSKDGRIITFGTKVNSVAGYPVKSSKSLRRKPKMRMTQLKLVVVELVKQPNKTEKEVSTEYMFAAKKEKLSQARLDNFSMQGMARTYRFKVFNIGNLADLDFSYFIDETGKKYTIKTFNENLDDNTWTVEGEVSNGI
ncbi:hypothetical protein [Lactococcus fujiensis]|nr:hypothetical protein [Lactococcus fujiensis]